MYKKVTLLGNRTQAAGTPKLTKFVFQLLDGKPSSSHVILVLFLRFLFSVMKLVELFYV